MLTGQRAVGDRVDREDSKLCVAGEILGTSLFLQTLGRGLMAPSGSYSEER